MPKLIADRPVLHTTSALTQVMAEAKARELAGERVLHLERGEPDFETPPHIVEALAAAARGGETHYPDARGVMALRAALVEKLARENGILAHPDDVVVTNGGTHGLYLVFQGLLSAGDELLVLSPHWMAIPKLVGFADGATMRTLPAYLELQEGAWGAAELANRIAATLRPNTRGIYLNTPNNPTGAVLNRQQLEAIAAVALEHDLWVVSDEAYEHLVFDGVRHVSFASLPGMAERTVSVFTFSKSYAMTGWRLGYVVTPPAMRPVMGPLLSFYTTHGVFPSVQLAGLAAITGPQAAVETMRAAYEQRRDALLAGLEGQSAVHAPVPHGAFYAFANVAGARAGRDIWTLVREWLAMGVAVLPGTAFGPGYDDWVRLSLATRAEDVVEAARRLHDHALSAVRA
ncbi:MAG TPA: aminotransferase class I/II-fold pyridoxal phosphate-dependent enzyme [Candidatus Eisenbacteria bacterium]|nr:aminotransferase class I/II-fold pyridoxal phosphate-dependent enzyme [Candidatus Eisenbacteria bacterium]